MTPPRDGLSEHANELMRILGRLEGAVEALQSDIEDGKESRGRIHAKLEKIEEDVGIVGQVAAQARTETTELKRIIDEDVKPATDDYKRVRAIGRGTLWAVGLAAGAAGITAANFWEFAWGTIRHWLHIP